ncbi:Diaminopimelate decarboxylas (DAP decarboxylase) [Anopheles sinensis]|uniref:Diaminopimelate decarboxylas (DAP decarboxylase) n=1 Tax=Anopheles sinensis TaxID=74873 RepID=A0A084VN86_ANOSI|nr:Diaminopimelate decarboxylas (DAP decarboxylase) [Anopheles sinensis]
MIPRFLPFRFFRPSQFRPRHFLRVVEPMGNYGKKMSTPVMDHGRSLTDVAHFPQMEGCATGRSAEKAGEYNLWNFGGIGLCTPDTFAYELSAIFPL